MQRKQFFRMRHIYLPALAMTLLGGWFLYFMSFPVGHDLYKKVKVNNLVNLYVTQASAGAMTSFSYHYYLVDVKKSDADFMDHINSEKPFMITNDDRATAIVKDDQLYLRVRGDIYSFSNVSYRIRIHLDASPY